MINAIDLRIGNWVNIEGEGFIEIKDTSDINRVVLTDTAISINT
jgi:hypothetical protein